MVPAFYALKVDSAHDNVPNPLSLEPVTVTSFDPVTLVNINLLRHSIFDHCLLRRHTEMTELYCPGVG